MIKYLFFREYIIIMKINLLKILMWVIFFCIGLVLLLFIFIYCVIKSGVLFYIKVVVVRFFLFIILYILIFDGVCVWFIKLIWKEKYFFVYKIGLYKMKNNMFCYDDEI